MKLRMLNDAVLVKPDPDNEFNSGSEKVDAILKRGLIVLPEIAEGRLKKTPMRGKVISFGPDCKHKFRPGDRIIFVRFGGVTFKWRKDKLRMMREYEVLAKEEA